MDENDAMAQMIESFVESTPLKAAPSPRTGPASKVKPGPKRKRY